MTAPAPAPAPAPAKDAQHDPAANQHLVQQVELLTKAVACLASCLTLGPCWGSTGDVKRALDEAWRSLEKTEKL
jgi:hypothetical protein